MASLAVSLHSQVGQGRSRVKFRFKRILGSAELLQVRKSFS